jgi:ketol-acid reductoisomerase
MKQQGFDPLVHQRKAFGEAARGLNALQSGGADDMRNAMNKDPALIAEAANGRTTRAIQAMVVEGEIRIDAGNRADRFVADWKATSQQMERFQREGHHDDAWQMKQELTDMAEALHRDPQLESLLQKRSVELGLKSREGSSLSHDLQEWLGRSRGLGIGM